MTIEFNERLCFIEDDLEQEELINKVSSIFMDQNLVTDTYAEALINREKEFPTGFDLGFLGVAIPHVEEKYVKKNALWIASVKKGCTWKNNEDNSEIQVHLCFGLLLSNPNEQLKFLQWLSACFQNKEFLLTLSKAENRDELHLLLDKRLRDDEILAT